MGFVTGAAVRAGVGIKLPGTGVGGTGKPSCGDGAFNEGAEVGGIVLPPGGIAGVKVGGARGTGVVPTGVDGALVEGSVGLATGVEDDVEDGGKKGNGLGIGVDPVIPVGGVCTPLATSGVDEEVKDPVAARATRVIITATKIKLPTIIHLVNLDPEESPLFDFASRGSWGGIERGSTAVSTSMFPAECSKGSSCS